MNSEDFALLARLLRERSGLVLSEDKAYLLESRLTPVARKHDMANLRALAQAVRQRSNQTLIDDIVEAMTTNESSFFRDTRPFETFKDTILPRLLEARSSKRSLRIWSAACSSGQEPYSLAMVLKENEAKLRGWRVEILGTDISREMVQRAKEGVYSQFEVQRGLPIQQLVRFFTQEGDRWRINDEIRRMVTFREHNLLGDIRSLGTFDVVFCRNVLIYFEQETKRRVLDEIAKVMASDGALLLGGAETVLGISDKLKQAPGLRGVYVHSDARDAFASARAAAL